MASHLRSPSLFRKVPPVTERESLVELLDLLAPPLGLQSDRDLLHRHGRAVDTINRLRDIRAELGSIVALTFRSHVDPDTLIVQVFGGDYVAAAREARSQLEQLQVKIEFLNAPPVSRGTANGNRT